MSVDEQKRQRLLDAMEWTCSRCGDDMPCRDHECPLRETVRTALGFILEKVEDLHVSHTRMHKELNRVFHALRKRPN